MTSANRYTLFGKKLKNQFTGLFIKEDGTICSDDSKILKLAQFSVKLYQLMSYFTKNDMKYLMDNFSHEEYIKLGGELYRLKLNPLQYPEYEQIRSVLKLTIELLYAYVKQYNRIKDLDTLAKKVEEQEKILNSVQEMKERIGQLQKQVNLFEDTNLSMPEVQVHFEMIIYMQRYGFPENGVFDTDKLQEIMDELSAKKSS
jgi:hypothetical protein